MSNQLEDRTEAATQMTRIRRMVMEARPGLKVIFDRQPVDRTIRFRVETETGVHILPTSGHLSAIEVSKWSDTELWERLVELSNHRL